MLALVALVAGVQFYVTISGSLMLEGSITEIAIINGISLVATDGAIAKLLVHQGGRWTD